MIERALVSVVAGLCLLCAPSLLAQDMVLHVGESLDGVTISTGGPSLQAALTVNRDKDFLSEGDGSIHLAGVKPENTVAGRSAYLAIDIPVPAFTLSGKALCLDVWSSKPEATRGLYVRALDERGRHVASWSTWNANRLWSAGKVSLELIPRLSRDLTWEAGSVHEDALPEVTHLRIFAGTRDPGAPFDVFVDNIRLVPSDVRLFTDVEEAAPLFLNTVLVEGGEAQALIVTPDAPEWQALGSELSGVIAELTGATLDVKAAGTLSDQDLYQTNAVLLGNVVNNPRLLYCYTHQQVFVDDFYPGAGGFDLRSVHDPWGTGKNIISIGAADVAGARAAIDLLRSRYLERGADLIIPRMLEVSLTGEAESRMGRLFRDEPGADYLKSQQQRAESGLETGVHTGLFGQARNVGQLYALTRKPAYAEAFVWLIRRAKSHHASDPTTYGGPWGMDSDFTVYTTIPAWAEIENDPSLTDADRLEIARILFQWVNDVASRKGRAEGPRVRFNHQTFPALGLAHAGHYFARRYDAFEAESWLDSAEKTFGLQIETYKPHCDCNSYQWLTLTHTVLYSLATQNLTYFENGNIRRNVDYLIHTMNNLGYQVAYGDIGGWGPLGGNLILSASEWFSRDGRAQWALDKKMTVRNTANRGQFTAKVSEAAVPEDLVGATAWPIPPHWYASFLENSGIPIEKAVDKVIFRNGFEADDQYLLLDGLSVGGHGHMDGNAILAWTENNRIWLADGDYIKALPKFHNGMLILRDGQSAKLPPVAELVSLTDLPNVAVSRTAKRDYAGADWTRSIIWLKGRAFLVLDRVEARTAGDYSLRTVWQTVGDVSHNGAILDIDQQGQFARIALSDDTHTMLHDDPALGKNWGSYPHAREPVIRVFQGLATQRLEAGESRDLFTALHASGEAASGARLRRVAPNAAVFTGAGEPVLVLAPTGGEAQVLPGLLAGEGELFVVSPSRVTVVGARRLSAFGMVQNFVEPMDVEIDLRSGARSWAPTRRSTEGEDAVAGQDNVSLRPDAAAAVTAAIEGLLPQAMPPAVAGEAGPDAPALEPLWQYTAMPSRFLLSNNAGSFGAIDTGLTITATPEPLAANVFSGVEGGNTLDRAFDGQEQGTSGAVMWADDQEVTIDLDFGAACRVESVLIKAWFGKTSSKNKAFLLGRTRILASNDGFVADRREILDRTDSEDHQEWSAPVPYLFDALEVEARQLRLILTPRPGSGIYLAEVETWGRPQDMARLPGIQGDSFSCIDARDIDGDGDDEIAVGAESGHVYCLNADGSLRWSFNTHTTVRDLAWVDFLGDGRCWLVAGGVGGEVFAIDHTGKGQWTYQIPTYKRTGHIRTVFTADLEGNGRQIAMVGAENWRYYALDVDGKKLWHYESVHPSTKGIALDIDGDGKQEVALGTAYYTWHLVNTDGSRRWGYRTRGGPGATAVAAGDVTGDGAIEVLFGGEDSFVQVVNAAGKPIWQFNTGDEITGLFTLADPAAAARDILVSSLSFNVYRLDGSGAVVWRTDLGSPVRTLAVHPAGNHAAAACDNGMLYLLDTAASGAAAGRFSSGGRIGDMAPARLQGRDVFVTAGENGRVYAIPVP